MITSRGPSDARCGPPGKRSPFVLRRIGRRPFRARSVPAQIIAAWDSRVTTPGGALPGARLTAPQPTRVGWSFTLHLDLTRQVLSTAVKVQEQIAGRLDLPPGSIIIEGTDAPARCRLQVLTRPLIGGGGPFPGPGRVTAGGRVRLELGPYIDGSGQATYLLYSPGSMWGGLIIGSPSMGAVTLAESVVISALSGGDTEYWYLRPRDGAAGPLAEHADWLATVDQAEEMLDAATEILDARGEEASHEGWTGFTPAPGRPGLLIVVEECHDVFASAEKAWRWACVVREGRKVGLTLLVTSPHRRLEIFGGVEALRSSVMEGNLLVLGSTSDSNGLLMAGLPISPAHLPAIPGCAYTAGPQSVGVRTSVFQGYDTRSGRGAGAWLAAQPRPGLDALSAAAAARGRRRHRDQ